MLQHMESYLLPVGSSFLIRVKSCPSALGEWSLTHRITTKVLNYLFFFFSFCSLAVTCRMWDLSSLTTDLTHVPCGGALTTRPPGKSQPLLFFKDSLYFGLHKSSKDSPETFHRLYFHFHHFGHHSSLRCTCCNVGTSADQ